MKDRRQAGPFYLDRAALLLQLAHQPLPLRRRALLFRDVPHLDDGSDRAPGLQHRAGGEGHGIEVPVPVDEHLFSLLPQVAGKRLVDGALFERVGAPVGARVVDVVVKRLAPELGQREPGQPLGGRVHVRALLVLVHDEERQRCVVRHRLQLPAVPLRTARVVPVAAIR